MKFPSSLISSDSSIDGPMMEQTKEVGEESDI